jgi:hypothetical protein
MFKIISVNKYSPEMSCRILNRNKYLLHTASRIPKKNAHKLILFGLCDFNVYHTQLRRRALNLYVNIIAFSSFAWC